MEFNDTFKSESSSIYIPLDPTYFIQIYICVISPSFLKNVHDILNLYSNQRFMTLTICSLLHWIENWHYVVDIHVRYFFAGSLWKKI